jgi:hypothetical protein
MQPGEATVWLDVGDRSPEYGVQLRWLKSRTTLLVLVLDGGCSCCLTSVVPYIIFYDMMIIDLLLYGTQHTSNAPAIYIKVIGLAGGEVEGSAHAAAAAVAVAASPSPACPPPAGGGHTGSAGVEEDEVAPDADPRGVGRGGEGEGGGGGWGRGRHGPQSEEGGRDGRVLGLRWPPFCCKTLQSTYSWWQ